MNTIITTWDNWRAAFVPHTWLLTCAAKSVLILVLAWLAGIAWRRASAATRHWLWLLALVGIVALPVLFAVTPAWRLPILPTSEKAVGPNSNATIAPVVAAMPTTINDMRAGAIQPTANEIADTPALNPDTTRHWNTAQIILLVWAAGVLVGLIYLGVGLIYVGQLSRGAREIEGEPLRETIENVLVELGWSRPVRIWQSDRVSLPMTWGWLKPVVLFPAEANHWSVEQQRMVLLHELAHIQRRDYLTQFIARVAVAVYWFNPLAWMALRQLRIERERACDDLVLNVGSPASNYANHLLDVARMARTASLAAAAAVPMAKPSQLERRLLAILDTGRNRSALTRRTAGIASLVSFASVVLLSAVQLSPAPVSAQTASGKLRYQWKQGQGYSYSVKVEATTDDYIETTTGNVTYNVRNMDGDNATLTYHSYMSPTQRKAKPGKSMMAPSFGFGNMWSSMSDPFGPVPELRLDSSGQVLERKGKQTSLPQALGDIEGLVFEPLSPDGKSSWQTEKDCAITYSTVVPLSPMSHMGRREETTLPAREKIVYKLGASSAGTVKIIKQYTLATSQKVGSTPRLQMEGEGTITFDTVKGVPREMEFKGAFIETSENTTQRTPLVLSYKLLEGQTNLQTNASTVGDASNPSLLPANNLRTPKAGEISRLIADLKSSQMPRQHVALSQLANLQPNDQQVQIEELLIPLLDSEDWATRQNAAKTLGVWGGKKSVAALIKILDDPEFSIRWAIIEALEKLKDADAIEPLVKHLANRQDNMTTKSAVQSFGPDAEKAVLAVIKDKDPEVRRSACDILKDIGTKDSVPALQTALRDTNAFVSMSARAALPEVQQRAGKTAN